MHFKKLRGVILLSLNWLASRCAYVTSWRLRRIKADRPEKEISSSRPAFVCFSPSVHYLILIHSISQNVLPPFLFPFYLSQAFRCSTDFPSFTLLGPRAILSQSLLHVLAFFQKLSRPRSDGAIAQMLTRPELRDRFGYPRQVHTYLCYICNRKLYPDDEINRSRRPLRNAFGLSADSFF